MTAMNLGGGVVWICMKAAFDNIWIQRNMDTQLMTASVQWGLTLQNHVICHTETSQYPPKKIASKTSCWLPLVNLITVLIPEWQTITVPWQGFLLRLSPRKVRWGGKEKVMIEIYFDDEPPWWYWAISLTTCLLLVCFSYLLIEKEIDTWQLNFPKSTHYLYITRGRIKTGGRQIVALWLHLQATFTLHGQWLHLPVPKKSPAVGSRRVLVLHLGEKPGLLARPRGSGAECKKLDTSPLPTAAISHLSRQYARHQK